MTIVGGAIFDAAAEGTGSVVLAVGVITLAWKYGGKAN